MLLSTGLSDTLTVIVGLYALVSFCFSLYDPKIGFYLLIPAIGLGFEETALIKGGLIALVFIGTLIHLLSTKERFTLTSSPFALIIILFGLMAWLFLRAMLVGDSFDYWAEWVMKRLFIPGLLLPLALIALRDERSVMGAVRTLLGFGIVTAVFGIMQYFTPDGFFWTAREALSIPGPIAYQIIDRLRISGLSSYVVPLAYQLGSLVPIALAVFFMKGNMGRKTFAFLVITIITIGLVLTLLKSAVGGAVLGVFIVFVLAYRGGYLKAWAPLPALATLALVIGIIMGHPGFRNQLFALGAPTLERIPITISAINVVVNHPLGVGPAFSEYVKEAYADVSHYLGAHVVVHHFPHNIILNIGAILGLPALALVVLFYYILFRGLMGVARGGGRIGLLGIGFIGSFVAYIVNAMFHNNNPFFGDAFNWLIIGVAAAAIQIWVVSRKPRLLE